MFESRHTTRWWLTKRSYLPATYRGCALAEPSCPWRCTFALCLLGNRSFFHRDPKLGTLWFTRVQRNGPPSLRTQRWLEKDYIDNIVNTFSLVLQDWIAFVKLMTLNFTLIHGLVTTKNNSPLFFVVSILGDCRFGWLKEHVTNIISSQ